MPVPHFSDEANFFHSPAMPGVPMLAARYFAHAFVPHWHEGYVVAVITEGAEGYRYHGATHVAGPGWLACINPAEVHTGRRAAAVGWAYRVFYPLPAVLQRLACDMGGRGTPWLPVASFPDRPLARALVRAHRLLEFGAEALEAQTATIDALSALLTRHANVTPRPLAAPGRDAGRAERMRERLAADLAEPVTLDELAAVVGLSPFHAARLFARETGMPPHAWRNMLRINRSLDMLRRGVSVAAAAAACGFVDQSHFTRHFRRALGVTPGRWRG